MPSSPPEERLCDESKAAAQERCISKDAMMMMMTTMMVSRRTARTKHNFLGEYLIGAHNFLKEFNKKTLNRTSSFFFFLFSLFSKRPLKTRFFFDLSYKIQTRQQSALSTHRFFTFDDDRGGGGGGGRGGEEDHRPPRETFTGAEQRGAQKLDPVSDSRSEIEMFWKNVRFSRPRQDENDRRGREEDGGKRRRRKSGDAEKR